MKCLTPISIRNPAYGGVNDFGQELQYILVPCGKCFACQSNRRSAWSFRLWCECLKQPSSLFVTLTYDDDHLPKNNNLCIHDLQTFIKRLRKNYKLHDDRSIKYFACGEYGSHTLRPHYHAILFGLPLSDGLDFINVWSKRLFETWQNGFVSVAPLNGSRIGYCTKYILKGDLTRKKYQELGIVPPFMVCSRRPSIGLSYLEEIDIHRLLDGNCKLRKATQSVFIPEYYRRKLPDYVQKELKLLIKSYQLRNQFDLQKYYNGDFSRMVMDEKAQIDLRSERLKTYQKQKNL